jgi:hypothetical protein
MGNVFLDMNTPTFLFCLCCVYVVMWLLYQLHKADVAYWKHVEEQEEINKTFTDGNHKPIVLDEFEERIAN